MVEKNGNNSTDQSSGYSLEEIHRRLQDSEESNLTADPIEPRPWDRVQIARHPERPYTLDYVGSIFSDFTEIHGDRRFADDQAIVAGMARFHGEPCMIVGHQKGRTTRQRQVRNFGMPKPEGYRKALRVMKLAEKFSRPVFTFIDSQGAYPGIDAEERGEAESIAHNVREMTRLRVPVIVTITGEGMSGGALAIGVGDILLILENSVYSVITPEGCSSILWKDRAHVEQAARSLKITAQDLLGLGIADQIVPEPPGGAHTNHGEAGKILSGYLADALGSVRNLSPDQRLERRYQRLRAIGEFSEGNNAHPKGADPGGV